MSKIALLFFLFQLAFTAFSQRVYNTKYANDEIKIDGELTEDIWSNLEMATDFVVNYPKFGDKSSKKTEVFLWYSDDAIYYGGKVYDDPDSISYFMSQRDNFGNADYIGLTLDTYGNKLNAFAFYVTSTGVELDALVDGRSFDYSWNAVWKSRVQRVADGWTFEMKIPYSAIRFPNNDVQKWNVNFERQIRRSRESTFWSPVNPEKYGEITQAGKLLGIENIEPPVRLSFSPYSVSYLENSYNSQTGKQEYNSRVTGGMDVKWGLNDAFTLDMTLVPDFGQTISDNQVLNLGPFEVAFDENRSFFKEGTDLFGIGNVFYSRRIGGRPYHRNRPYQNLDETKGERVISDASRAPLLNGSKISGRTKSGLGIGVFNAIEGRTASVIEDNFGNTRQVETNPLTNYNVTAFSQNLTNNGRLSFVNTNVTREGESADANVSVLSSTLFTKDLNYSIENTVKLSNKMRDGENVIGHNISTGFEKSQGRFRYGFGYYEESDTYDPNDLGLLFANNSRGTYVWGNLNNYVPKGRFLRRWSSFNVNYEELYFPRLFSSFTVKASVNGTFNNFLTAGVNGGIDPLGYVSHFESRTFGVPVNYAPSFTMGGFYSSDYSKPIALDFRANTRQFMGVDQWNYNFNLGPRFQVSSSAFIRYSFAYEYYKKDYGFVSPKSDVDGAILMGNRNRNVVVNSLNGELVFTKRMGMDVRFRHYWQAVEYLYFGELQADGSQIRSDYYPTQMDGSSAHNTSYNAFTIDINYKWVFFPGCEFQVFYKNNIFSSQSILEENYLMTFDTLFDQPQFNSISGKILVFVDVLYFKGLGKNKI